MNELRRAGAFAVLGLWLSVGLMHTARAERAQFPSMDGAFEPPEMIALEPPEYPAVAAGADAANNAIGEATLREGWVRVAYQIGQRGATSAAVVVDSSGDALFEAAAMSAVARFRYAPARLDGRPVAAGAQRMMVFVDPDRRSAEHLASAGFSQAYDAVMGALANPPEANEAGVPITQLMAALLLHAQNLYEHAYYQLARYNVAQAQRDRLTQFDALRRALALDGYASGDVTLSPAGAVMPDPVFPELLHTDLMRARFALEMELKHYAAALDTATRLEARVLTASQRTHIQRAAQQIRQLRDAPGIEFAAQGRTGTDGRFSHRLLRNAFSVSGLGDPQGVVRVYCERGEVQAVVPGTWHVLGEAQMPCQVFVAAQPDSAFELVEGQALAVSGFGAQEAGPEEEFSDDTNDDQRTSRQRETGDVTDAGQNE